MRWITIVPCLLMLLGVGLEPRQVLAADEAFPDFMSLDLEDLLDIQVVSVSKRAQSAQDAAAAIFVITAEDMRRTGATTIADALRMVPGLDVRRIDSNKWAVTSRGFNGRFSNKLLVLVDGRSVYTTLFSGVYWELQDMVLEDLDRIEIIRGPGATMWGANAVNGVINVITKHAADSQGTLVTALGGSHEEFTGAVRQGFKLGAKTYGRVSVKSAQRGDYDFPSGDSAADAWKLDTAHFRVDSEPSDRDVLTVQGDVFDGAMSQTTTVFGLQSPYSFTEAEDAVYQGRDVRLDWRRTLSPTAELSLQAFYDHMDRNEAIAVQVHDVMDVELRYRFRTAGHMLSWGGGYRRTRDDIGNSPIATADEQVRRDDLFSAYLQDDVTLLDEHLHLTIGSKFEHNGFTGGEVQPGVRLLWNVRDHQRVWGSAARAVRTPSRAEHDVRVLTSVVPPFTPVNPGSLPVVLFMDQNADFRSEALLAYELGYRYTGTSFNADLALFLNDYDRLRVANLGGAETFPDRIEQSFIMRNAAGGRTYGAELAFVWIPRPWIRLDLGYAFLKTEIVTEVVAVGSTDEFSPEHTVSLRSSLDLPGGFELDAWLRSYSESVTIYANTVKGTIPMDALTTLDLRLGWRPLDRWHLSLTAQNLLAGDHLEYVQETFTQPTLIRSGWYAKAAYEF